MKTGLNFEPKRILIFRVGHLGDTLVAMPAIWTVKRRFPRARLTLLSNISLESKDYTTPVGILPRQGVFDHWLSYPTQTSRLHSMASLAKLFVQIRLARIDTVVYLLGRNRQPYQIGRDIKFFRLAGVKQIIGTANHLENHLPAEAAAPLPALSREYEFLLDCVTREGIAAPASGIESMDVLFTPGELAAGNEWFDANVAMTKNVVAVAPGSKWPSKVWDEEKFVAVLSRLITSRGLFPVIVGGPEDKNKGEAILKRLGVGANAAGQLSIREAGVMLGRCSLYLGNDTGAMHMAAAVGVPCVAIFAAIDYPGRWHPFGENNVVLRRAVPCEGCHSPRCKFNRECLDVSADQVFAACEQVLNNAGK